MLKGAEDWRIGHWRMLSVGLVGRSGVRIRATTEDFFLGGSVNT